MNVTYGYDGKDLLMLAIGSVEEDYLVIFELGILGFYIAITKDRAYED